MNDKELDNALNNLLLDVVESVPDTIPWKTLFGLVNLEFSPNVIVSMNLQALTEQGEFVNLMEHIPSDMWSRLSRTFSVFVSENFYEKPDQMSFTIQSTLKTYTNFAYDLFNDENNFLAEQLRWTYNLTGEVPNGNYLQGMLNENLVLHNEPPIQE